MAEEENRQAVERLWRMFEARRWGEAGTELADDFVAVWPHTGEIIRGRENFIAVNSNYPPVGWHIVVRRVVASGDVVVSEVEVPHDHGTSYAASFIEMKDGKISKAMEYWVEGQSEEPPPWRAQWVEQS